MNRRTPGDVVFRALLRLHPAGFRARFGDEMTDFFHARWNDRPHGVRALAAFWIHLIVDGVTSAASQHLRAMRGGYDAAAGGTTIDGRSPTFGAASWRSTPMHGLGQDLQYAFRFFRRQPGFTIVAVLTLALGIGATTAIFSVVDAVLLRPLPWPGGDRLVVVYGTRGQSRQNGVAYLDFRDWRAESTSFDEMGVIRGQSVNLTGGETPERLSGSFITAGALRLLGASTLKGRLFTDAETEIATKAPVAIVNEAFWRTRLGGRQDVLGGTLVLNGRPFSIVGVMRPQFEAPLGTPDVWMPIGFYPNQGELDQRGRGGVLVYGRLKAGLTVAPAQAELDRITEALAARYPATNAGVGANVMTVKEDLVGSSRTPLLTVLASVGSLLLIACANVASLQIARAAGRRREMSVRAVLGARRARLVRQLLTENVLLAAAGGGAGVAVAFALVAWLRDVVPTVLMLYGDVAIDRPVLLFALVVTLGTGLLFGMMPAWQTSSVDPHGALSLRLDTASGLGRSRPRRVLVIGQLALSLVLLAGAGLLVRSLVALVRESPGFDATRVLTMQFRLPATKYDSEDKIADMFTRTIEEIRRVPGVERAALVRASPLNGNGELLPYAIEAAGAIDLQKLPTAHRNITSPGYFDTLGIPRLEGRDFNDDDRRASMPVSIVNQQLARKVAPAGSAVGRRIALLEGGHLVWSTIVGVVGNARHFQLEEQPLDQIYLPYTQRPRIFTEVVVRTTGDPVAAAPAVRAAIWRVDHDQPVWRIRPLALSVDGSLGGRRFMIELLASFAAVAVLLAAIGVYGVMSHAVARRRQEMGIRMALGARGDQVLRLILGEGLATIGIAISIGLAIALVAARALATQLYGVSVRDPITYLAVTVLLASVAMAACYSPARRASRVDPAAALRDV